MNRQNAGEQSQRRNTQTESAANHRQHEQIHQGIGSNPAKPWMALQAWSHLTQIIDWRAEEKRRRLKCLINELIFFRILW